MLGTFNLAVNNLALRASTLHARALPAAAATAANAFGVRMASHTSKNKKDEGLKGFTGRDARKRCAKYYIEPKQHYKSMWENPECCVEVCHIDPPRYDELYWVQESDKRKRKYMQTWIECPPIKIVKKPVCCFEKLKMPKYKKRVFKKAKKDACEPEPKCRTARAMKCPRFKLPRCKKVRNPPKCLTTRKPKKCRKRCTPYPSFSECQRDPLRKGKIVECECLKLVSMCEVWDYVRKMNLKLKKLH